MTPEEEADAALTKWNADLEKEARRLAKEEAAAKAEKEDS